MNTITEPVFTKVKDWLKHLNREGEVYPSRRSMIVESPISLADLQRGLPENRERSVGKSGS